MDIDLPSTRRVSVNGQRENEKRANELPSVRIALHFANLISACRWAQNPATPAIGHDLRVWHFKPGATPSGCINDPCVVEPPEAEHRLESELRHPQRAQPQTLIHDIDVVVQAFAVIRLQIRRWALLSCQGL